MGNSCAQAVETDPFCSVIYAVLNQTKESLLGTGKRLVHSEPRLVVYGMRRSSTARNVVSWSDLHTIYFRDLRACVHASNPLKNLVNDLYEFVHFWHSPTLFLSGMWFKMVARSPTFGIGRKRQQGTKATNPSGIAAWIRFVRIQ